MSQADFTARSLADIDEILDFIARDKPGAALKLIESIQGKCQLLANFPQIGTVREELATGLRSLVVGKYVIYFRATSAGVRVERVLHSARELDDIF